MLILLLKFKQFKHIYYIFLYNLEFFFSPFLLIIKVILLYFSSSYKLTL